ncbi:MAG: AAA family ATPase [Gemmatimonadaceae bacterium]
MSDDNNIVFKDAARSDVSLVIALAGPSGSGKTRSALELARGLAGGDDSLIAGLDTEAGRMLHFAAPPGQPQGVGQFKFKHADIKPPFTPERYADAIDQANATGRFKVIVVDSFTHEWEGEGGCADLQEEELRTLVAAAEERARKYNDQFNLAATMEKLGIPAWKPIKRRHKRLVNHHLLQSRAHVIVCLRAEEKLIYEKQKDARGREKTVILQTKDLPEGQRWIPICEKRFMFEMTASFVLSPETPGVPYVRKLPGELAHAIPLDKQLSEASGRLLAEWARGGGPVLTESQTQKRSEAQIREAVVARAFDYVRTGGPVALNVWRRKLTPVQESYLAPFEQELHDIGVQWKPAAEPTDDSWADQEAERRHQARTTPKQEDMQL